MRTLLAVMAFFFGGFQGLQLQVLQRVDPVYPPLALAARVQRSVKLSLKVSADGTVESASIVEGHSLLNDAAIQAAKQFKFNRTPFGGTFDLTVPFQIPATITGTLTGRVTDSEGRPIAGVRVSGSRLWYSFGRREWNPNLQSGVTDAEGNYTVSITADGDYYIVARYQVPPDSVLGSADRLAPRTFYPGTLDAFSAATVSIRLREMAVADIRIPQTDTVRISGKILVPPLEQPPRGPLDIRLLRLDSQFVDEAILVHSARLENQNQTEVPLNLRGVPAGQYRLAVTVSTGPPNWVYTARVFIDARDRDVENFVVPLRRNIEFKGRVISEDPALPLQKLNVGLMDRGGFGGGFFPVAEDGSVRLYNLPEGDYYVLLQGELASSYGSDVRIGTTSVFSDSIVTIKSPMEDLQIVLRSNGGAIDGMVQNNLRAGVSGAEVRLVPDGLRRQNPMLYRGAKADASGAYRFLGVAPGDYKLFAFEVPPPGDATQNAEFISKYEQRGVRVAVREGTSLPGVLLPLIAK